VANLAHVVVLGAGFGGLEFCKQFHFQGARVTLVDRTNHHIFQPLLYQVATAGLSATDVAQPIRSILSGHRDITVIMDSVTDFNLAERKVILANSELHYDFLVIALGGCTSYFGHPEWEKHAPGLKSLEDAVKIRSQVLTAFEKAEMAKSREDQERLMTTVVVGGGPTGVELAGAISDLARHVLRADFRRIDSAHARVVLLEGGDRVLAHMAPDLSASAQRQLTKLGVKVRVNARVKTITEEGVELESGEKIPAANILWAAGVSPSPLTKKLGVHLDRAGHIKVNPDLSLPDHPEVFAVGDLALVLQEDGKPVPGVSPAAMQMATHVAHIIEHDLNSHGKVARPPFKYWDKGTMATIGRSAAVVEIGKFHISGFFAWLAWLMLHLVFLVGFRNKILVLVQWLYSYATYKSGARIVFGTRD
jgi:NADH dehydrogenase